MASEKSKSDDWKWWAAAGVGVAVAVGGIFYLRSQYNSQKKKTKRTKRRSKKSSSSSVKTSKPSRGGKNYSNMPAKTVQDTLLSSLKALQASGKLLARDEEVREMVLGVDMSKYDSSTRLMATQFLVIYHSAKVSQSSNVQEYKTAARLQMKEMDLAWSFLDMPMPGGPSQHKDYWAFNLLKVDVAQRLKDGSRLLPVYDLLAKRGNDMTQEESMVVFTTAPIVGRLKDFVEAAKRVEATTGGSLQQFHLASLQRPDLPDYEVMRDIAKSQVEKGVDNTSAELTWLSYKMNTLRLKLKNVESTDPKAKEDVEKTISSTKWKDIPFENEQRPRIVRSGSMVQTMSLAVLPMSGFVMDEDSMFLRGYVKINVTTSQHDKYELRRKEDNLWSGVYTMKQSKDGKTTTIQYDMEVEFVLEKEALM